MRRRGWAHFLVTPVGKKRRQKSLVVAWRSVKLRTLDACSTAGWHRRRSKLLARTSHVCAVSGYPVCAQSKSKVSELRAQVDANRNFRDPGPRQGSDGDQDGSKPRRKGPCAASMCTGCTLAKNLGSALGFGLSVRLDPNLSISAPEEHDTTQPSRATTARHTIQRATLAHSIGSSAAVRVRSFGSVERILGSPCGPKAASARRGSDSDRSSPSTTRCTPRAGNQASGT